MLTVVLVPAGCGGVRQWHRDGEAERVRLAQKRKHGEGRDQERRL